VLFMTGVDWRSAVWNGMSRELEMDDYTQLLNIGFGFVQRLPMDSHTTKLYRSCSVNRNKLA